MERKFWDHVSSVRARSPLVHNITNTVVTNLTANALLAAYASPVMAHACSEVKDMVALADALLINIGTLDESLEKSMLLAAESAHHLGKPWVLDPVGAGATPYRDAVAQRLIEWKPTVIRGNASEILALARAHSSQTRGVDSTASSTEAMAPARQLAEKTGAVVCVSGETDGIVRPDGSTLLVQNGHPLMTRVTGLGCTASALTAAFVAVIEDKGEATAAAMTLLGIAGQWAEQESRGPGSLQWHLLDKLHNITEQEFVTAARISVL